MTTATAPDRSRLGRRRLAALISLVALVGVVYAVLPSVLRLLDPPDPLVCPAIWPPATSCAPGMHLAVAGGAVVVLTASWLVVDHALRQVNTRSGLTGAIATLAIVALLAWSAARVPQPYFVAWLTVLELLA